MVDPCAFRRRMPSRMEFLLCGSTATVGSSKKMSSGLCAMPHAMFSRRSRPPESLRGRNFA